MSNQTKDRKTRLPELYTRLQLPENCTENPADVAFQQFASPQVQDILHTLALPNDRCQLDRGSIFYRQVNRTLYCERQEKQSQSPQQFYRKDDLYQDYQLLTIAVYQPEKGVNIGLFISHNDAVLYENTSDYEIPDKNTLGLRIFQISKRLQQSLEKMVTSEKANEVKLREFMEQQNFVNTILYMNRDILLQLKS